MSSLVMVTLRDGSQVPQATLATTTMGLQGLTSVALFELVEKCKDASYRFVANPFGDSKSVLKKRALIDGSETVHEDVRKIVLNSIEGKGLSLKLVDPLQGTRVTLLEKNGRQIDFKL